MTLVDTSVWIDFFRGRRAADRLQDLLDSGEVVMHPWVIGELALGVLGPRRDAILRDLWLLPASVVLSHTEILELVEAKGLAGSGIGWVDCHLLGAALVEQIGFWTSDRRLARVAARLELPR